MKSQLTAGKRIKAIAKNLKVENSDDLVTVKKAFGSKLRKRDLDEIGL